jgi:group I intron endonuclease
MIGIYKIISPSKRIYIGQSNNLEKRLNAYIKHQCKGQTRLFNSFQKYGFNKHTFEIIEECLFDELNEKERYWQEYYDVLSNKGLNCVYVNTTYKKQIVSQKSIEKRVLAVKGKKLSDTHKQKIKDSWKNRVHSVTDEVKRKISIGNTGKKRTELHKIKYKNAKIGIKASDITKLKMKKPKSEMHKQNISTELSKPIIQYTLTNVFIKEWKSATEASLYLPIKRQNISACCKNKVKTSGGYKWKFKEY